MTTYVLSQQPTNWHVSRYGEESGEPLLQATTEQDALSAIIDQAEQNRPSQIVRIGLGGDSRIIAQFERDDIIE